MTDISKTQIKQKIHELEKVLEKTNKRLTNAPEGKIIIKTIRGHARFYKKSLQPSADAAASAKPEYLPLSRKADAAASAKQEYLSLSRKEEIIALVDKRYCETLRQNLTAELTSLKNFDKSYHPEAKYRASDIIPQSLRSDIKPIIVPNEEKCRIWQKRPFKTNGFPIDEALTYKTTHGELVRSRMEFIIANTLTEWPLAYRYEQELTVCGQKIYPDFTIMHPETEELYYLEFFGMMNDEDYAEKTFRKIILYQTAGLASHLICLFDRQDSHIQTTALDHTLESFFGPKKNSLRQPM